MTPRLRRVAGPAALLGGSAAFQVSAAVAVPAFTTVGPAGTSGLRYCVAAVLMLAVIRPRFTDRTVRDWLWIAALGVAVAAMTFSSYQALDRIDQGTATTLEFLGPLTVAILGSRTRWHVVSAGLAVTGVVLLAGPSVHASATGLMFGLLTAAAFATYIVLQNRAGQRGEGMTALALSLLVAALVTLPAAIPATSSLTAETAVRILLSGILGVGLAYGLDTIGIARVGAPARPVCY